MLLGEHRFIHARQANGTRNADGCLVCTDMNPSCDGACPGTDQCVLIN